MRRVLMISPHFPPDGSAGAHRVRLLAPHLPAHGWLPTVLTLTPDSYEGRLDPDLAALVPGSLAVERVAALPARWTRRVGLGDLGLRALPALSRRAARVCAGRGMDALFVTIYPSYPALLGPRLKTRFDVPFVLDYQDPWVGAWGQTVGGAPDGGADLKSRLTRALAARLEPHVLAAADGVTAVSARTYEEALARTGAEPKVAAEIPIGWDAADEHALSGRSQPGPLWPDDGRVHVCYVGTLLPMGVETLKALLAGLKRFADRAPAVAARLAVHFIGTSNQTGGGVERVMPHARAAGVAHLVDEFPARVDYLDALALLRRATALLLLGSTEPHYTPSKAFPALLARRPLLALYHQASTVVGLVRAAAPEPSAQVITYTAQPHLDDHVVAGIATSLATLAAQAGAPVHLNHAALDPWSAPVLAGRLAALLDVVAA